MIVIFALMVMAPPPHAVVWLEGESMLETQELRGALETYLDKYTLSFAPRPSELTTETINAVAQDARFVGWVEIVAITQEKLTARFVVIDREGKRPPEPMVIELVRRLNSTHYRTAALKVRSLLQTLLLGQKPSPPPAPPLAPPAPTTTAWQLGASAHVGGLAVAQRELRLLLATSLQVELRRDWLIGAVSLSFAPPARVDTAEGSVDTWLGKVMLIAATRSNLPIDAEVAIGISYLSATGTLTGTSRSNGVDVVSLVIGVGLPLTFALNEHLEVVVTPGAWIYPQRAEILLREHRAFLLPFVVPRLTIGLRYL